MTLEGISGIRESAGIPPADFTNLITEWNGKGVQLLRTEKDVWLARRIPADAPDNSEVNLSERITSVNSKILPTVEQVLDRNHLKFAPRVLGQRNVVVLESTTYTWILMPLQPEEAESLQGKITEVDALDYEEIRVVLENRDLLFSPSADSHFAMTQWV